MSRHEVPCTRDIPGRWRSHRVAGDARRPRAAAAFTLIESVAGLAIVAVLGALAAPLFRDWIAAYQLANHARHIAETMAIARTEAVRRGHRVGLCKSTNRRQCDDGAVWDAGFVVFVDPNRSGHVDADATVIGIGSPAPPGITIHANRPLEDYVSYTSLGNARMLSGALQMGTFTVCRSGFKALNVVLANSGRVRVEKTSERCP